MKTQIISEHKIELSELCKKNGVKALFAFGSVVSDKFDEVESDIDFIVEIDNSLDPLLIGEHILNLWNGLEKAFNRPVDLLRMENIRNPIFREQIDKSKVLVYAA
jgi:predicted nucleotidyltransferase